MGDGVGFRKGALDEIRARALASHEEVCGLLLGKRQEVSAVVHCRNVAASPATTFEIDPAALIAALRAARQGGPRVVGCYHSHPSGRAEPSLRDAADAAPNGWLWLIVGGDEARLFRAVKAGAVQGRFEDVPLFRVPAQAGTQSHAGPRPPP